MFCCRLTWHTGNDFKDAAKAYLSLMLDKGVPSTFANLKHLYNDTFKKETLAELAAEYLTAQDTVTSSKDKGEAAALYYLAQHYNYHLSRDLAKAADYVEKAIQKDPKSVDFHMTKARILKHSGDLQKASETMDRARTLDLKDRYINSKAAKYQLRNNENDRALKTVGLFTRAETVGGPMADLLDMQCIWFLTEDGEAYARQGNTGMALKRFHAISNIFDVWQEDQFDFHSFSLRKGQIRAYVDTMRWEDHIRDHPFYSRAALDAIDLYLKMADKPAANGANGANGEDSEDALARKKAAKKAKKEQQRLEREAAEKQAKQDPNKGNTTGEVKKTDEDPLGLKLASTTEPLVDAMKFLGPLLQASPRSIEAQIRGFEVYMRRKKYVLALRCLNAGLALGSKHPELHVQAITFRNLLSNNPEVPPKVAEVLKAEFKTIDASQDLRKYNDDYRKKHQDSPSHVIAAIKAEKVLGEDKSSCEKKLLELVSNQNAEFAHALEILDVLKGWRSSETDAFKKAALSRWPDVTRLA
jgi:tetratricopeptide (TPR) repeat protein